MRLFLHLIRTIFRVFVDALMFMRLCFRPTAAVAAENLFLRKQLGLFLEREVKARRATDSIRFTLARLSRWFDWREALIVVKPDTLIPISEAHIRQTLKCWVEHYNRARPHSSLGPGTPDPSSPKADLQAERHCIPKDCRVVATSILGGLHHEYRLEKVGA